MNEESTVGVRLLPRTRQWDQFVPEFAKTRWEEANAVLSAAITQRKYHQSKIDCKNSCSPVASSIIEIFVRCPPCQSSPPRCSSQCERDNRNGNCRPECNRPEYVFSIKLLTIDLCLWHMPIKKRRGHTWTKLSDGWWWICHTNLLLLTWSYYSLTA